jgi:hypothetical protein
MSGKIQGCILFAVAIIGVIWAYAEPLSELLATLSYLIGNLSGLRFEWYSDEAMGMFFAMILGYLGWRMMHK